ncbi:hypothetical protein [Bifidobacterium pseudolongum]|uniref:hypothetical protein n=1 Tax=Bifidobacterium pseudolongum TaxID=1694 RepID=UPI0010CE7BE6|nr:hypothetical protein [Bifidobacterium pseudolongum]RYQ02861.1 transposase [Bifidobacterium pseudolongum subsp. globosum]RYQ06322.1 transposase [Bifidobacterium pseudolongum subsp. globosum]RYQ13116.1 transposase [Bifidobacterium pseudolongum subsp. globosum]
MPLDEDGLIDFRALTVKLIETVADHAMELEADELLGGGNRGNGYRERRPGTVIGEIALRVPKLREDTYLCSIRNCGFSQVSGKSFGFGHESMPTTATGPCLTGSI